MADQFEYPSTNQLEQGNEIYREEESLNPMPLRKVESSKNQFILISTIIRVLALVFFIFSAIHLGLSPYFLVLSILEHQFIDMSVQIVSIIFSVLIIILQGLGLILGISATLQESRFRVHKAKTFRGILIIVFLISFVNLCCSFVVHATTNASFVQSWYIPTPIFIICLALVILFYSLAIFVSIVFVRLVEKEELQAKNLYSYDLTI